MPGAGAALPRLGRLAMQIAALWVLVASTDAQLQCSIRQDNAPCRHNVTCNACLNALLSNSNHASFRPSTVGGYSAIKPNERKLTQISFFNTLRNTTACAETAQANSTVLANALLDEFNMQNVARQQDLEACPYFDGCMVLEFLCFSGFPSDFCASCLDQLYTERHNSSLALNSEACNKTVTNVTGVGDPGFFAQFEFQYQMASVCNGWPTCTLFKSLCKIDHQCNKSLSKMNPYNPSIGADEIVQLCPTDVGAPDPATPAGLLNGVIHHCTMQSMLACDFWKERCMNVSECNTCFQVIGADGNNIGEAALNEDCIGLRSELIHAFNANDPCTAREEWWTDPSCGNIVPLYRYLNSCPNTIVPQCNVQRFRCWLKNESCPDCLNHTAFMLMDLEEQSRCNDFLGPEFRIEATCNDCPESVYLINFLTYGVSIVGAASIPFCLLVITLIVAHGRDKAAFRNRIILGMMSANLIYSGANSVPVGLLQTSAVNCGQYVYDFADVRDARAWWFGAKYALIAFETFILAASITVLKTGTDFFSGIRRWAELLLHLASGAVGAVALIGFQIRCTEIIQEGWNYDTQREATIRYYEHTNRDDDFDDDSPSSASVTSFRDGVDDFNALMQHMQQVWCALLGVALCLWMTLRILYHKRLVEWRTLLGDVSKREEKDPWGKTMRSRFHNAREELQATRQGWQDVAKPLEPYVLLFLLFGIPASFMATDFCADRSGAEAQGTTLYDRSGFTYGTCYAWCEFVLSFRSLGAVCVYFSIREHREGLYDRREAWRGLQSRVGGWFAEASESPQARHIRKTTVLNPSASAAIKAAIYDQHRRERMADTRWHIPSSDVALEAELASGAFGVVWRGTWQGKTVAVKVLKAKPEDEDEFAKEDFRNEVDTLKSIDHPCLLAFHGFGIDDEGHGFAVTEFMSRGSLRGVLGDESVDMPWSVRLRIALDIARGMEHLHSKNIVHRDLKSDNCLLDEWFNAKVADFGSCRQLRPVRPNVVVSLGTFTGAGRGGGGGGGVREVQPNSPPPGAAGAAPLETPSRAELCVGLERGDGLLTKGCGTLLWMSPEAFRGDTQYDPKVDVYSYGIIMWELATRQTPWDNIRTDDYCELLRQLENALQNDVRPEVPKAFMARHRDFVAVMRRCWEGDPGNRWKFSRVLVELKKCKTDESEVRWSVSSPPILNGQAEGSSKLDELQMPLLAE